jgi:hypothetical protein
LNKISEAVDNTKQRCIHHLHCISSPSADGADFPIHDRVYIQPTVCIYDHSFAYTTIFPRNTCLISPCERPPSPTHLFSASLTLPTASNQKAPTSPHRASPSRLLAGTHSKATSTQNSGLSVGGASLSEGSGSAGLKGSRKREKEKGLLGRSK